MSLAPVGDTLGLWRDPAWARGMPGVYALVIGVSAYPHLAGGSDPAPETFGLEQLFSSASTAAALFEWLREGFKRDGLPVVWCQLLLSPTQREREALLARGLTHYAIPTFVEMQRAIQRWTGNIPSAPPASRQSRALLFFSGHGVQANSEALLLPSDYLDPSLGDPHLENCFSARDLRRWMEESPIAEQLALIDACRNEFSPLASKGASAHGAFPKTPPGGATPRAAASLASASPNQVAYQLPNEELTCFGRAVMEALRGRGASSADLLLEFDELVGYVRPRVNEILKKVDAALDQTVRRTLDGDGTPFVVAEVPPPPMSGLESMRSFGPDTPPRPSPLERATDAVEARFDASLEVRDAIPLAALRGSRSEAHRRFGHEHASELWVNGVTARSLRDGAPIDDAVIVRSVDRDAPSARVRVDLELRPSPHGLLLVLEGAGDVQRERLGIPLPTDVQGEVPIRLVLTLGAGAEGGRVRVQKVDARLGPAPGNAHYDYLWQLAREADLGSLRAAAERADPRRLVAAVESKQQSPTAAVAGVLLLASARSLERVKDWPRNLMRWFPEIPDGAVLWARSLRDAIGRGESAPFGVADPLAEMVEALALLLERGLPFFAESVDMAQSLTRWLSRAEGLDDAQRARVLSVDAMLERAARVAMPSGHFLVLSGLPRPAEMPGQGALSVEELRSVVRPRGTA